MADRLEEAIAHIRAGDKAAGRRILAGIVAENPRDEQAWQWMAGVVDTDEQRLYCVRQVLKLNPGNQAALYSLASLERGRALEAAGDGAPERAPARAGSVSGAEASPPDTPAANDAEITEMIVRELSQHRSREDLILRLCEMQGIRWPEAEALVHRVATDQEERIRRQRAPLLIVVALATIGLGAYLALPNIADLIKLARGEPAYLAYLPLLWREIAMAVVGLAMAAGGAVGLVRIASPPAGGLEAEDEANRTIGGPSLDDVLGAGIEPPSSERRHWWRRS